MQYDAARLSFRSDPSAGDDRALRPDRGVAAFLSASRAAYSYVSRNQMIVITNQGGSVNVDADAAAIVAELRGDGHDLGRCELLVLSALGRWDCAATRVLTEAAGAA